MQSEKLLQVARDSLEDLKAKDICVLKVSELTTVTDYLVIASGTSGRHVNSLANNVVRKAKEAGQRPLGTEGQEAGEWVLIDLQDVIVHVMQPRVREFYKLEDLWAVGSKRDKSKADTSGS